MINKINIALAILVVSTASVSFAQDASASPSHLPRADNTVVITVESEESSRTKPTSAHMKAVLQMYVDHFNAGELQAVVGLFADDAVVEDPVGQSLKRGKKMIAEFYKQAIEGGAKLRLAAPICGSYGKSAAIAFQVTSGPIVINVIDVMAFNDVGKIVGMKAYWGPDDIQQH
jgi:steroid delta-isomerase